MATLSNHGEMLHFEAMIDLKRASELVDIPYKSLVNLAAAGRFPAVKIGKCWRTRESLIDEWIREQLNSKREKPASTHEREER